MADEINVRDNGGGKFRPHPEGQYIVVCVDTVNLGERVETYAGKNPRVVNKCAVVFWSGEVNEESGEMYEVNAEFSVSMNEKAGLRKFLESWRGRSYTADEAKAGVPLHKLCGVFGLASIEHKVSGGGRTYAKIKSIAPLPKQMQRPVIDTDAYLRGEFWEQRRKAYAEEVAAHRNESVDGSDDYASVAADDDSGLPF